MVSSIFHRHSQPHPVPDPSTLPRPPLKTSLALSGLNVFSSSAATAPGPRPTDGLDFVPYVAPSRAREQATMGDLSYEIAHPSKFSDWTDDGDERALPPPSLGIGLLSKARAAIKLASSSKEGSSSKSQILQGTSATMSMPMPKTTPTPILPAAPRARAPTLAPLPAPTTESPIKRWLDLGISLSPPSSPTARRPTFIASPKKEAQAVTARMTAFQFLDGASPLGAGSPSRIRRQTDIGTSAKSYAQMMSGQQTGFGTPYPDFEVHATPHAGPSNSSRHVDQIQMETVKPSRRTTAPAMPKSATGSLNVPGPGTMSMTKITIDQSSSRSAGESKSSGSVSRRNKETIFASFKRKERIRSDKPRVQDVVAPPKGEQCKAGRQSLPAMRLKEMFNTEPSRAVPPLHNLGPAIETSEFGVMAVRKNVGMIADIRDSPQPARADDSPLLGRQPWSPVASPRAIGSPVIQRIRELTGDSGTTLVNESPGRIGGLTLELGSPMVSPCSLRTSANVSPFSAGAANWAQSPGTPIPPIGVSFLSMGPSPSPGSPTTRLHHDLSPRSLHQGLSPARDDISLVDPDLGYRRFELSPSPSLPVRHQIEEHDISRSPTPETEGTDQSPQTKRVRSLTDMRDAFRRMQAFTGLDVSECDSRRTSTTVGGDASDEDGIGAGVRIKTIDDDAGNKLVGLEMDESPGVAAIVAQHIESVNLVLAQSPVVLKSSGLVSRSSSNNAIVSEIKPITASPSTSKMIRCDSAVSIASKISAKLDYRVSPSAFASAPPPPPQTAGDKSPSISRGQSGVSFHTALDDLPASGMSRSISKSSSVGAFSSRETTNSLVEHVERREGSGWWSDSSRADEKAKSDEIIDKRLAALEDKAKSSPSPFQALRSNSDTPLADGTPRRSSHGPRLSLVGDSTWSQGDDGSPVRRMESPRRVKGKRRASKSRTQSIGSPSRHFRVPVNPPCALVSIDGQIAPDLPGVPVPSLALALKSPFARKVSPDIARRAGLITHANRHQGGSFTPTRRRTNVPLVGGTSRKSDDEEGDRSLSSQSASGSDISSLCRLERELGTTVKRRSKEIDTLIKTLSQTRKENTTLRTEVVHRHAVLDDMLEERQEMKDEIRELRLKLAKAERESLSSASSPIRPYGSVRSERSAVRNSPETRRRPSLARIAIDHDRSRSSSSQGDIESLVGRYSPKTPTRPQTLAARSPAPRRFSSARSDISTATSAGVSIHTSLSRR